ncbi:MAG: WS/DGAT/MGAT family O-acyltransferase [Pseudomonadales bacterium]
MQQLTGLDATFITQESERMPMHISFLLIYDPSTVTGGFVRFKDILRTFESRLHMSPVFRRKLLQVPFGVDLPYWVEADDFDLEYHVRHIALPAPGDWRQLSIQIARLHSRMLNRSRPLWEAYVIEGLDNIEWLPKGSFAIFLKMHHSAIDGIAGLEIVGAIHDLEPTPVPGKSTYSNPAGRKRRAAERLPGELGLLARACVNNLKQPVKMARSVGKFIPAVSRIREGTKAQRFKSTPSLAKQNTRFSGEISSNRAVDSCFFNLNDIKAIKNAVQGATVNDVVITIISGALRRYLEAKNELPTESLVCAAPISTRIDEELGSGGNRVSVMMINICTDIADPLQRLQQVHKESTSSKEYTKAVGARTLSELSESAPPLLTALGMRAALRLSLIAGVTSPINTVISNVPGSRVPLYMGGAQLLKTAAFAPITDNMGLLHGILSQDGGLSISFTTCREMLPDPAFYSQCIIASFSELQAATEKPSGNKRKSTAKIASGRKTRKKAAQLKAVDA